MSGGDPRLWASLTGLLSPPPAPDPGPQVSLSVTWADNCVHFLRVLDQSSVCVTLPELLADTLVSVAVAQPSEDPRLARRLDNQADGGWPVLTGSRGLPPLSPAVEARSPIGRWRGLDHEVCGC